MASYEEMNEWALRALVAAVGEGASVRLVSAQNRHADEEEPSWTLRVEARVHGVAFTVENDGPDLFQVISDAWAAFDALGIDLKPEHERLRPEFEARRRARYGSPERDAST